MKQLLLSLALLTSLSLCAQDYYWVGGTGNWSDLTHWATTSGGVNFHTELPGPTNDVYFDENSFLESGQTVFLDLEEAYCHNFFGQGVVNNPSIQGDYYQDDLYIYGDFLMTNNWSRDLKTVHLMGEDEGNILDIGGNPCGELSFFRFEGTGEYLQQSNINVGNLYLFSQGGTYDAGGRTITCVNRFRTFPNYATNINLEACTIYAKEFQLYENSPAQTDFTYILMTGTFGWDFIGGGNHFSHVEFDGSHVIVGDASYDDFIVNPGATVEFEAGSTQTAGQFTLNGSIDDPITLLSSQAGTQANLVQTAGEVNASYLVMQDNNASGGATFNAITTIDNGNNTGWNIQGFVPQEYYWVGGEGDWTDLSHWATTSGGSTFHTSLPTFIDNVYFDANSFDNASNTVTISGERSAANIDATGALAGCTLQTAFGSTHSLTILGDFLAGNLTVDLEQLTFNGGEVSILSTSSGVFNGTTIDILNGTEVQLQDDIVLYEWFISSGDLTAPNRTITCQDRFYVTNNVNGTINLTNGQVNANRWVVISSNGEFLLDGSTIYISNSMVSGPAVDYYNVVFTSTNSSISGTSSFNTITIEPQADLGLATSTNIFANDLIANGTENDLINIRCVVDGETTSITFTGGDVEVNYVLLKDNHAIGSGSYFASNSINNGNTNGWEFDELMGNDYFWVGGEGDWSDLSHWATSSGGSDFHTTLPTLTSTIYFDENSFLSAGDAVTYQGSLEVQTIDATGALAGCALQASGSSDTFSLRGDLIGADMSFYLNLLNFNGSLSSVLSTNSGDFTGTDVWVDNATSLTLTDDIHVNRMRVFEGDFTGTDLSILCDEDFTTTNTLGQTVNLTGSTATAADWSLTSSNGVFEMDQSTLIISNQVRAGFGTTYNTLIITGEACFLNGSCSMNLLQIEPTANLIIEDESEFTLNNLVANGTPENLISIECEENGGTTFFIFNSDITVSYVALKDNHAVGSGTYTAQSSVDGGNTDGWFIDPFIGVEEYNTQGLMIYPNPTTGIVNLNHSTHTAQLTIFDFAGRSVAVQQINSPAQIDLSFLPAGSYILSVESAHQTEQQVLIVQ